MTDSSKYRFVSSAREQDIYFRVARAQELASRSPVARRHIKVYIFVPCLLFLSLFAPTRGQGQNSPPGQASILQDFEQEQSALAQEWNTLVSQGATPEQMDSWRRENLARFQAQQQRAQNLSTTSMLQPIPALVPANLPANLSTTGNAFLTARTKLANAHAELNNQLLQRTSPTASQEDLQLLRQQAETTLKQEYALDLQAQAQRTQALSAESASQLLQIPGSTIFPPNATPRLKAYLALRDTLARSWARLRNQYAPASPAARAAAMARWQQQNAALREQLRTIAQAVSTSSNP